MTVTTRRRTGTIVLVAAAVVAVVGVAVLRARGTGDDDELVSASAGPAGAPSVQASTTSTTGARPADVDPLLATSTTPVTTTEVPATTSPPSTTTTGAPPRESCLSEAPVEVLAPQVVMAAVWGPELDAEAARFAELGLGGALLMTAPPNLDGDQLLLFRAAGRVPLLVATDEEGGSVQRLAALGQLPSAAAMAAQHTPSEARQLVAEHGEAVARLGVDVVFGPVVDVAPPGGGGPIDDRAFSDDPQVVGAYGAAYVEGWDRAAILPVIKHFPGHGGADADSHHGPARTAPLERLEERDLVPYHELTGSGAGVMVGHLVVPGLTDRDGEDLPASVSPAAVQLLRDELGYRDAIVFSDALDMDAITDRWSVPEAAVRSLRAGVDMVEFTTTEEAGAVVDAIVGAVEAGELGRARLEQAVGRVLEAKGVEPCTFVESVGEAVEPSAEG